MKQKYTECIECKKPFVMGENVYSEAGLRETQISGECEECFDKLLAWVDEQEEDTYHDIMDDPF